MRLGVHVSIAGGFPEAVVRAKQLSCTTMQIFSRSPRGGAAPKLVPEIVEQFHRERETADIRPLAVHGPYILNLASPDARMWAWAASSYREEYARDAQLHADYLVTHVGSHKGDGEDAGIARVAKAVSSALEQPGRTMVLLENTAGSGQGLGYTFEHLAAIRKQVKQKDRVGVCLDTAHLFAAGYAIHTADGLEDTLDTFDRTVGLEHVKLIHLNDSKAPFQSHVDRHWHIGQGHIGLEAFRRIVTHPRLASVPFILETPKDTPQADPRNLKTVRELAGAQRRTVRKAAR